MLKSYEGESINCQSWRLTNKYFLSVECAYDESFMYSLPASTLSIGICQLSVGCTIPFFLNMLVNWAPYTTTGVAHAVPPASAYALETTSCRMVIDLDTSQDSCKYSYCVADFRALGCGSVMPSTPVLALIEPLLLVHSVCHLIHMQCIAHLYCNSVDSTNVQLNSSF